MKRMFGVIALLAGISVLQLGLAQVPAGAPSGATGLCNDGTYSTAASKSGACRGHKGIKTWYAAADATKAKASAGKAAATSSAPAPAAAPSPAAQSAPAKAPTATPAPAPKASGGTVAQAPGGGAGQVWLNTASNVYHCQGTQWYGKTKAGAYMTEDEAKAKGARPDHGKPCK
ncbi:DUF3761 domain-containing protein [Telmatobacter sp. DSM 110680]|uniref:DUF3761 domain-containing protein n=1 Tax=Telmatobacter sp. DSM 110680 TaxID=3036704 RepID=A0AAU7DG44_9BACT